MSCIALLDTHFGDPGHRKQQTDITIFYHADKHVYIYRYLFLLATYDMILCLNNNVFIKIKMYHV